MKKDVLLFLLDNKNQRINNLGKTGKLFTAISSLVIAFIFFVALQTMFYFLPENKVDSVVLFPLSLFILVITVATAFFSLHTILLNIKDIKSIKNDFTRLFAEQKSLIIPFLIMYTLFALRNFASFINNSNHLDKNEYDFVTYLMSLHSNKELNNLNEDNKLFEFGYFFTEFLIQKGRYKTSEDLYVVIELIKKNILFQNAAFGEVLKSEWLKKIKNQELKLIQSKISNFE